MKPSDFITKGIPMASVLRKSEAELIAKNVMIILNRTGNEWRQVTKDEYETERKKDGGYSRVEAEWVDATLPHTGSPEACRAFSPKWAKVYDELSTAMN